LIAFQKNFPEKKLWREESFPLLKLLGGVNFQGKNFLWKNLIGGGTFSKRRVFFQQTFFRGLIFRGRKDWGFLKLLFVSLCFRVLRNLVGRSSFFGGFSTAQGYVSHFPFKGARGEKPHYWGEGAVEKLGINKRGGPWRV